MATFEGGWHDLCEAAAARAADAAATSRRQALSKSRHATKPPGPAKAQSSIAKATRKVKKEAQEEEQAFAEAAPIGALSAQTIAVGDLVEARYKGGEWYPGRVTEVANKDAYVVHYDDGDNEKDVPRDLIRLAPAALALAAERALALALVAADALPHVSTQSSSPRVRLYKACRTARPRLLMSCLCLGASSFGLSRPLSSRRKGLLANTPRRCRRRGAAVPTRQAAVSTRQAAVSTRQASCSS